MANAFDILLKRRYDGDITSPIKKPKRDDEDDFSPPTMLMDVMGARLRMLKFGNSALTGECVDFVKDKLAIRPKIKIYGKEIEQARDVGFFSEKVPYYTYSRTRHLSKGWAPCLQNMVDLVNKKFGASYNGILVNRYAPDQCICAHSDNEQELDSNAGVVTLSVGQTRSFVVRWKKAREDHPRKYVFKLKDGEMLQMAGQFQQLFTHEVPRDKNATAVRYSFTFRHHE